MGVPLLHIPDPWSASSSLVETLADSLTPRWRVLSLTPRPATAYQVWANDIVGVLNQFGFQSPVVLGEGVACVPVAVVAAWYPERVGRLVLVSPSVEPTAGDDPATWSLLDSPPNLAALRARVTCDVLEVSASDPVLVSRIEGFLAAQLP